MPDGTVMFFHDGNGPPYGSREVTHWMECPPDPTTESVRSQDADNKYRNIVETVVRTLDRMDYGLDTITETVRRSREEGGVDPDPISGVTWAKVAYACGLGSASAASLCIECGVEPDHDVGRDVPS